ncbi:chromosome partitioning protein ParA [Terrihabitans soli]|uniref:non-specific protein-tyrosine kinase n=1 Tax=Terrihabitans soli TaxID=708113 RepID=A0A6S6QS69_9HYPH|nr:polysaccharide biosynthesis tyrosine autokinase [Terrihabitans soli]BCJ91919.1 chromosome partitioning protein ParA [Terrihabitans soli]
MMLERIEYHRPSSQVHPTPSPTLNLDVVLQAARRQMGVIAGCVVVAAILALVYLFSAVPQYTATAKVLINRTNSGASDRIAIDPNASFDSIEVESEMEILKSERIAALVVDKLDLSKLTEFSGRRASLGNSVQKVLTAIGLADPPPPPNPERARAMAIARLQGGVDVNRIGRSYGLELEFTSIDPKRAAAIANGFVDAYLDDQMASNFEASKRASEWLQKRIEDLKQQSLTTDLAVQKYRAENSLLSANGRLVSEQQLADINSQLSVARTQLTTAAARFDRLTTIIERNDTTALVTEALDSGAIQSLRQQFIEAQQRETQLTARVGPEHAAVQRVRDEKAELSRLMMDELRRIAQGSRSEVEITQSRVTSLQNDLTKLLAVNASANDALVVMRELEREAETYRTLYQSYLARYQEAVQRQSFPASNGRLINAAKPPGGASSPNWGLAIALAMVAGGAIGTCLGGFREWRDRTFRRAEDVRDVLGLELLGMVPLAEKADQKIWSRPLGSAGPKTQTKVPLSYVIDNPLSQFAETMRSIKIEIDLKVDQKSPIVIGIVSTYPDEGKSTISANLAASLASAGAPTLLIDADMRKHGLTIALGAQFEKGLQEVLTKNMSVKDVITKNKVTGLSVIPSGGIGSVLHTGELLSSPAFSKLVESLSSYRYIVLDLPPLAPIADVRGTAANIDAFVYVVEWGRTEKKMAAELMRINDRVWSRTIGVVLNKVEVKKFDQYSGSSIASYGGYYAPRADESTKA